MPRTTNKAECSRAAARAASLSVRRAPRPIRSLQILRNSSHTSIARCRRNAVNILAHAKRPISFQNCLHLAALARRGTSRNISSLASAKPSAMQPRTNRPDRAPAICAASS